MGKQPLYPSTKGKGKAPVSSLRQVSIKRLRDRLESQDFNRLMGHAEGLWQAVVDLSEDIEKVRAKTTTVPISRVELTEILQELKVVQSFAFNLTEY